MKKRQDPKLLQAVALRLNALLLAKGMKDAEMARRLKIKPQTWNNYTQAMRPLPIGVALQLVNDFGVTLDWLYRGNTQMMPHGLLVAIEQQYSTAKHLTLN